MHASTHACIHACRTSQRRPPCTRSTRRTRAAPDVFNTQMVAFGNNYRLLHYGYNFDGSALYQARRRRLLEVGGPGLRVTLSYNASLAASALAYASQCALGRSAAELAARNEGETT